jgi:hypothetical protein
MKSNVKVTFWLNKTKKNSLNLVPVYLRVWYDYAHFSKATDIWVRLQGNKYSTRRVYIGYTGHIYLVDVNYHFHSIGRCSTYVEDIGNAKNKHI